MTVAEAETDQLVNKAVQQVTQIATLPEITIKIVQMVEDPKSSARDLHKVIKHDVALSARILKVVNSAFYGLTRQVGSVDRAIVLLGLSTVKNIALAASVSKLFKGKDLSKSFSARDLWLHSLACGVFCRLVGEIVGEPARDELFVAGLMHDLGILVERQVFPEKLSQAIEKAASGACSLCQAEREFIGADHQMFGRTLADKWKFPVLFHVSTGYHHDPLKVAKEHLNVAAMVYLADALTGSESPENPPQDAIHYNAALEILGFGQEQINQIFEKFPQQYAESEQFMS